MAGLLVAISAIYVLSWEGGHSTDQLVLCQGLHSYLLALDAQATSCSVIAQLIVRVHEYACL